MEHDYVPSLEMGDRNQTGSSGGAEDDTNPACQSCRRRKLKCPRESPNCSQCIRLDVECVYTSTRKPGMKSGAIEALNKRLQVLEDIVLREDASKEQGNTCPTVSQQDTQNSLYQVSQVLIQELQKIGSSSSNGYYETSELSRDMPNHRKRKRQGSGDGFERGTGYHLCAGHQHDPDQVLGDYSRTGISCGIDDESDTLSSLPPENVLSAIIDKYFKTLQHWIPFLHQTRFVRQLSNSVMKQRNAVVLHAISSATLKFLTAEDHGMSDEERSRQIRHSRQVVMLTAMSRPTIENLQALIIVAFDHIGRGEVHKAWSLIGSLTRTVEYLRLTVEPEEFQRRPLRRPLTLLEPTNDWTEIEERRRLFWNIFLLDRYCSITTGWSTSLTSDDVHRKLPCDGGLWLREEMSDTPYFGIWNKAAAKIGYSIAFIPAHYPTPDHTVEHDNMRSPGVVSNSTAVDTSKLGAFAYCIEATESLSQVTTFFLQQRIDFRNRQEVGSWLTRFKELDLRLVHWKMFLPQKWKDSNISRDVSFVDMDPNLTLAHITHNTSMILLHQHIAYPPPKWNGLVKLPSSCSAETCQMAAVETSAICQKYLKYTDNGIVSSQFALCAFVAGRILLVHWSFYNAELSPEFFNLVECLYEMSRRWRALGPIDEQSSRREENHNIAAQYAMQLDNFHSSFLQNPQYCMSVLGYSQDPAGRAVDSLLPDIYSASLVVPSSIKPPFQGSAPVNPSNGIHKTPSDGRENSRYRNRNGSQTGLSDPRSTQATPSPQMIGRTPRASISNLTNNGWQNFPTSHSGVAALNATTHFSGIQPNLDYESGSVDDELTAMSNTLLGQQFLEMDRVITFDGTNFAIDLDGWSGMN